MKSVKRDFNSYLEIKKSKFYTFIYNINSKEEVNDYLELIKKELPKATHYVYAYRLFDSSKSSDDGEPTGTAGSPIMNVLEKEDLFNVLVIVVRYFGGIKLGAGGLIRAYTKSLTEALKEVKFVELVNASIIELTFNYDKIKSIDNIIATTNSKLLDKSFDNDITYKILVKNDNLDKFSNYKKIKDTITYI